ncbi:universal stress protein [Cryptosporangium sp. NPDC051539]|uniref:universal stress protein n=1 Tax=Cryptosporangium sp. NPDC051539 TaxID=3363962 RepID=UPI0037A7D3DD
MSEKRVVTVGVDGSESALAAVDWAVEYVRDRGVCLRLLHGLEVPVPVPAYTPYPLPDPRGAIENEARRDLAAALDRVRLAAPDVDVTASVVALPPIRALLDGARHSERLVVGCRGLNPVATVLLGSVSAAVAAHAACPVVVVRGHQRSGGTAPVVVGVAGTDHEDATLAAAFEEAAVRHAPLVAVHAWSDVTLEATARTMAGVWASFDTLRTEARNRLESTLSGWADKYPGVSIDSQIVRDGPAPALLTLSTMAQLIVVGSHGRGGFAGMRLGSVSRRLVHQADCPVLVVRRACRSGGEEEPGAPETS